MFMATMSRYFAAFDVSLIVSVHPYYIPYYITHEIKSRKVTQSEYGELESNTLEGGNFEREPAEVWNLSVGGTVCVFTGNQWNDLAPVFLPVRPHVTDPFSESISRSSDVRKEDNLSLTKIQ